MKSIVTPAEMAAVDAAAPEPVEVLIDRAGRAVARAAVARLGGSYGRRVVIVAGPGNNGADGRAAARHLERRGVRCVVIDALSNPTVLPATDLVIDAAFGTGLKRPYGFPAIAPGTPVLAVDIPSGIDGLTGEILGAPAAADLTVTFAALKPGLLIEPGRSLAGRIVVADIGLDVGHAHTHLVDAPTVAGWIPPRGVDAHKWKSAVRIIAGSPAMTGAAHLAARAAQRGGAGYVQLGTPGLADDPGAPTEAVGLRLPAHGWATAAQAGIERFHALVVGPGLGDGHLDDLLVMSASTIPMVVDGDALVPEVLDRLGSRTAPTVLTPHDGEWQRLGGSMSTDRMSATRDFAVTHAVVTLRKGPTTIVAGPDGEVLVVANGTPDLATAGTGDVLAGLVGSLLARGMVAVQAAAAGAFVHAEAGRITGPGMVAGDLADHLPAVMSGRAVRR